MGTKAINMAPNHDSGVHKGDFISVFQKSLGIVKDLPSLGANIIAANKMTCRHTWVGGRFVEEGAAGAWDAGLTCGAVVCAPMDVEGCGVAADT